MRVMIFGGTTEGREAAKAHIARGDEVIVCVTSAYAKSLLPVEAVVFDHAMDERQMAEAILRVAPDQLVALVFYDIIWKHDCLHPVQIQCALKNSCRMCSQTDMTNFTGCFRLQ